MPSVSPQEAASAAMAEYDTNKDGFLDLKELERCPALKNSLKKIDTNGDGRLSADEIAERIASFQETRTGLIAVPCRVLLDNAPLPGATVTLLPEKFMGTEVKPASGVSDARGAVVLRVEGHDQPGIHWGYFRIEVSKKLAAGGEMLPARYNVRSVLGQEISPMARDKVFLHLSSR
jgi:hypothetical protein